MTQEQVPAYRSFDGPLTFTSASGAEGHCYLSVYERRGSLPVVIAYEVASNDGPSVTNAAAPGSSGGRPARGNAPAIPSPSTPQ